MSYHGEEPFQRKELTMDEKSLVVSSTLKAILKRYVQLNHMLSNKHERQVAAPQGTEEAELSYKAYSVQPTIRGLHSTREKEYLLYYLTINNLWKDSWWILFELSCLCRSRKDERNQRIATLTEFAINDSFSDLELRKEAVLAGLQLSPHSWYGNGVRRLALTLKRIGSKIRAMQTSKVKRGMPQRPSEQAEPAHSWLPSWEQQYIPDKSHFEEEEDSIADLLSPVEVLFHLKRLSA
jgi:hypothetical protein